MSTEDSASTDTGRADTFSEEERAAFERLYERHEDDDIARIAAAVLQSSSTDSEDARS